jgi:hypothetical protein
VIVWYARVVREDDAYSIRSRTLDTAKDLVALYKAQGRQFHPIQRLVYQYHDDFELLASALSEDRADKLVVECREPRDQRRTDERSAP